MGQLWIFRVKGSQRIIFALAVAIACAVILALTSGVLTTVVPVRVLLVELECKYANQNVPVLSTSKAAMTKPITLKRLCRRSFLLAPAGGSLSSCPVVGRTGSNPV